MVQVLRSLSLLLRFLADLMDSPQLIRNVAIVGHLHHGKVLITFCIC